MKPRNDYQPPRVRNTLFGFIEVSLWHGNKTFVQVAAITFICEHETGKPSQGCRIGVDGKELYLRDDIARVMSAMTVEQAAAMKVR